MIPKTLTEALALQIEDRAREIARKATVLGWPFEDAVRNFKATTCLGPVSIAKVITRAHELAA